MAINYKKLLKWREQAIKEMRNIRGRHRVIYSPYQAINIHSKIISLIDSELEHLNESSNKSLSY